MNRRIKRTQTRSDRPTERPKSTRAGSAHAGKDRPKTGRPKTDRPTSAGLKTERSKGGPSKSNRPKSGGAPRAERDGRRDDRAAEGRGAGSRPSAKPPRFVAQRAEKRA